MSWPMVKLGDICRFEYGKNLPSADRETGDFKVFGSNGPVGTHTSAFTKGKTVIVGRKGSIGEAVFSERSCWPIDTTYYIDENSTDQDLRWLYYLITSLNLRRFNKATGVPSLNRADAYACDVPLPPLEEQKRIAGILDQADALLRLRARALEKLNTLGQAVFQEMFGDPLINPKNFLTSPLSAICTFLSGATPSKADSSLWDGCFPWVSPKDMKQPEIWDAIDHISATAFEKSSLKKIPINSVLIVVRGMILAHSVPLALTKVPCAINQDMKAMVFTKDFDPLFVFHCLQAMKGTILSLVDNAAHGTKRLDMQDLSSLPILSPSITVQQEFTCRASVIGAQVKDAQLALDKSLALFASLQSAAFQGKL